MLTRSRWLRIAPVALGLALTMPLQGCFGKFALSVKVWEFNRDISESYIIQELLFLGMIIIPVYEVVGIIDLFILNPLELITGNNPVAKTDGESRSVELADGATLTLTPTVDGVQLVREQDGELRSWSIRDTGTGMELVDERGELLAETVRLDDGSFHVIDADGQVMAAPGRSLLAEMRRSFDTGGTRAMVAQAEAVMPSSQCLVAF